MTEFLLLIHENSDISIIMVLIGLLANVNELFYKYNEVDIVFIFKQFLYLVSPFNCSFVVILFSFLCLSQRRHGGGWRPIGSSASSAIGGRSAGVADRRQ